jgi:hypothetical protein
MAELQAAAPRKSVAQPRAEQFSKLPMWWVAKLGEAPLATGATWCVACHLWHLDFKAHSKPFGLPNGALKRAGISRFAKWRALNDLEQRGLITIGRRQRKSPTISIRRRP